MFNLKPPRIPPDQSPWRIDINYFLLCLNRILGTMWKQVNSKTHSLTTSTLCLITEILNHLTAAHSTFFIHHISSTSVDT